MHALGAADVTGDVIFETDGTVAVITIDRPRRRNAIDLPTARAMAAALDELDRRDDLRAAVLTGAGDTFCAGMDLKALTETGERPLVAGRGAFGLAERPPLTPLVAAVEGHALGGGFEVALACDLIVASRDATFGLPEVRRGLVAAAGGTIRLPRRVPQGIAMEIALTGRPITAARARELGLVNELAEPGRALGRSLELARVIAENAPLAVRTAKRLVAESSTWPLAEAFERQAPLVDAVRSSADAAEGARAFVEKRAPVWEAR